MPTATITAKRCVNCHKDVSNGKRMKDSSGRYWCVNCGMADQKKKAGMSGEACADCGERFPAAKLSKMGSGKVCASCMKQQSKGPGLLAGLRGGGASAPGDKGKMIKMLAVLAVLAVVAYLRFTHVF